MVAAIPVPKSQPEDPPGELSLLCRGEHAVTFWRYPSGSWTVIEAVGEVDVSVTLSMREVLDGAPSSDLILDLSRVTFMDASGLAVLAAARRRGTALGRVVRLVGPDARLRRLLTMTGLDQVLPIYDCLEEATR